MRLRTAGSWNNNRGIATSLMEATLVITIAAILSTVAIVTSGDQVGDADLERSSSELKLIGISVLSFMQDTGHAPAYLAGNLNGPNDSIVMLLESGGNDPDDSTGTWPIGEGTSVKVDLLTNQINQNNPGDSKISYLRVGEIAHARFQGWNGPYMSKIPAANPWGDKYLVNIGYATSQGAAGANLPPGKRPAVFVISAGPNRSIETNFLQAADEFVEAGDDQIFRIQ
jgi:type II secretory pathway pseudopilin PulG